MNPAVKVFRGEVVHKVIHIGYKPYAQPSIVRADEDWISPVEEMKKVLFYDLYQ